MDDPFPEGMLADIEKFFEKENERCPGEDIYRDVFSTDYFFPLQRQEEMIQMIREARKYSPSLVYEIGADKGGSLYHWCKCLRTVNRVIASEIRGTPYKEIFEKAFPHIDFLWIEESSYSVGSICKIHDWLKGDTIDVAFIDGDKANFELDFHLIRPLMNNPSVVFMHDITDPAPGHAFREINKRQSSCRTIINRIDSALAMDREKQGIQATCPHEHWLRHWKGSSCGVGVININ